MEVRCNPFSQLTIKGRLCHEFAAALLEIQKRNTTHEIQNTKERYKIQKIHIVYKREI